MREISEIRKDIDAVDRGIILSLLKRMDLVEEVLQYKIRKNLPIVDLKREKEVIAEKISLSQGKLRDDFVKKLFTLIMKEARIQQQNKLKQKK